MIYIYSGTPGSGKSLDVARQITIWLRIKRNVISTMNVDTRLCFLNFFSRFLFQITRGKFLLFDVDDERMKNFYYVNIFDISPQYLIDFALNHHKKGKERQTLLILDECISIFSPEKCVGQYWLEWQNFFQYHRHLGYEVILVPQSTALLAKKISHFAEYEVRHRAVKNAGFFGAILSKLFGGIFSTKTYWRASNSRKAIDGEWFLYKYWLGKSYDSYCMFDEVVAEFYKKKQEQNKPKKLTYKQNKAVELCNLLKFRMYQLQQLENEVVIIND